MTEEKWDDPYCDWCGAPESEWPMCNKGGDYCSQDCERRDIAYRGRAVRL